MEQTRVTVVTVVYGDRWNLLRQVADAVLRDEKVSTLIIVDNGCSSAEEMDRYALVHTGRVLILRQAGNIGYSGAISKGLERARDTDCDYVFVLDDDSVPEDGTIDSFLEILKLFPDRKVVLVGNRVDVPGNDKIFYRPIPKNIMPKGTLFEVFSFSKFLGALRLFFRFASKNKGPFIPIVPLEAFVTGGSFLPIEAVREVALPDATLFIYGEDLEYSWRIRRAGYSAYVCAQPKIHEIDLTFTKEGGHIFSLFDLKFAQYKVYFRIRNAVIISRRNTLQSPVTLFLNIVIWGAGLLLVGLSVIGPTIGYLKRAGLILQAIRDGYKGTSKAIPTYIQVPK